MGKNFDMELSIVRLAATHNLLTDDDVNAMVDTMTGTATFLEGHLGAKWREARTQLQMRGVIPFVRTG
jgi:hypothetical protein